MKRIAAAILAVILLCPAASANALVPPELSAASAILVDGESGRVLFERNAHTERSIASITKLMTALVAAERIVSPEQEVTVLPEWTGIEGSSIYLRAGETVTMETLLYGLLLNSGNDAAVALAGACAGDVATFVEWMNARAAQLGMEHTGFTNPNGLSEEGHYSTAYDMALLARVCLNDPVVAEIVSTRSITMGSRSFVNHNKLLWQYDGCIGMKTGYTEASGRTLVSAARRDGRTLIAVTLNAPNDWADHTALFDYGFSNFVRQELCGAGECVACLPVESSLVPFVQVTAAQEVSCLLNEGEHMETRLDLLGGLTAPVQAGTVVGSLSFYMGGELIGETDLLTTTDVHSEIRQTLSLSQRLLGWFGRIGN